MGTDEPAGVSSISADQLTTTTPHAHNFSFIVILTTASGTEVITHLTVE